MEESRPSERDMMAGIQKPDLRCHEHCDVRATVREVLLWVKELEQRLKTVEEGKFCRAYKEWEEEGK